MIALLAATLRISAILLIALGLVWVLRKRTASLRHAVLVIAFICTAVVPALGAIVPPWTSHAIAMPPVLQTFAAPERLPIPHEALPAPPRNLAEPIAHDMPVYATEPASPIAVATAPTQSGDWRTAVPRILEVAWIIYLAGLAVSLAMLALGLLQLRWMAARSSPMPSDYWQWQASEIADAYGLRRPVLLTCIPHPSMLATWGLFRPQILLPAGAEHWPEDRIRAVLLHELAHIRRNDWFIQVFAGLLRAVHWFNPLAWIACARLRQESEQACDDEVLGKGVNGTEYAAHLLALARSFIRPARLLAPAPSMAHRSTLRKRIANILDPSVTHARTSRVSMARAAVALLAVTWLVAACRIGSPPARDIDPPSQASNVENGVAPGAVAPAVLAPAIATKSPPAPESVTTRTSVAATPTAAIHVPVRDNRTPQMIVANILEFVQAELADDVPVPLSQFDGLARTMGSVQRRSREILADDGRNPGSLAEKYTGLLNELGYNAIGATANASRNNRSRLSTPRLEQLAKDLRAKAADLADVVLPVPADAGVTAGPMLALATSAHDVAAATLADVSFVGPRLHTWLTEEVGTLQRAARSVIGDDGRDAGATTTKQFALLSSVRSTTKNAYAIADRAGESEEVRGKARALATSLRDLAAQFDKLMLPMPVMAARTGPVEAAIPSIGCAMDGQTGPEPAPPDGYKTVALDARTAAGLAYYRGSGPGVLAPRGWYCLMLSGSSGMSLYVTPRKLSPGELLGGDTRGIAGPAIQLSMNIGDTSGRFAAARYIARLFPQARSFVDAVIAENLEPAASFPAGLYPNDQLTRRNANVVEYLTPAGAAGLGYDSRLAPGGGPVSGVVILRGEDHSVLKLSARLPPELRELALAITQQVEAEEIAYAAQNGESAPQKSDPQLSAATVLLERNGFLPDSAAD